MAIGDFMAQELERHKLGDAFAGSNPELEGVPERRRLHLRRYGTHGQPLLDKYDTEDDYVPPDIKGPPSTIRYDGEESTSNWSLAVQIIHEALSHEFEFWNGFRTGTMAVWSVGIYTPAYMYLFRLYDRFLPKKTAPVIVFQVLFNLLYSIPVNALFFTYGTFVNHTTEWLAIREEWKEDLEEIASDFGIKEIHAEESYPAEPQFDWEMMWSKTRLKLHSELYTTMVTSAKVWIPINAINFTVVPPHLRPLGLIFCSVFWNCYLSLVQHRDVALPEGA